MTRETIGCDGPRYERFGNDHIGHVAMDASSYSDLCSGIYTFCHGPVLPVAMKNDPSADKANTNLALLAQAAATEHALTPLQAMRTHWRAFFWCIFMCVGALLWGYDAQVPPRHSTLHVS